MSIHILHMLYITSMNYTLFSPVLVHIKYVYVSSYGERSLMAQNKKVEFLMSLGIF